MKYIDGMNLLEYRDEYIAKHGEFPVSEVERILKPVAAALDYAHQPAKCTMESRALFIGISSRRTFSLAEMAERYRSSTLD